MGVIYFISGIVGQHGFVKIGITRSMLLLRSRFGAIQTSSPLDLRVMGWQEGDVVLEKTLHEAFRDDHVRGEWFKLSKDIQEYVRKMCKPVIWRDWSG